MKLMDANKKNIPFLMVMFAFFLDSHVFSLTFLIFTFLPGSCWFWVGFLKKKKKKKKQGMRVRQCEGSA